MAAPDPVVCARRACFDQRRGLRIVNHGELAIVWKVCDVLGAGLPIDVKVVRTIAVRSSVERVVECLRDIEERSGSSHDVPLDGNLQFLHQRHHTTQNLRHATADGCGIYHLDSLIPQWPRQSVKFIDLGLAEDRYVIVESESMVRFDGGFNCEHISTPDRLFEAWPGARYRAYARKYRCDCIAAPDPASRDCFRANRKNRWS